MATAAIDIANAQQVIPPPPVKIPARQVTPSPVTQKQTVKEIAKDDDEPKEHKLHAGKTLEEAAEDIKAVVESLNRRVKLSVEKELNPDIIVTKLIDRETDEVIRQIPSEELIELSKKLEEFVGIVFSKET